MMSLSYFNDTVFMGIINLPCVHLSNNSLYTNVSIPKMRMWHTLCVWPGRCDRRSPSLHFFVVKNDSWAHVLVMFLVGQD